MSYWNFLLSVVSIVCMFFLSFRFQCTRFIEYLLQLCIGVRLLNYLTLWCCNQIIRFYYYYYYLKTWDHILLKCIVFGGSKYTCREKMGSLATQMTEISSITLVFITWDQVIITWSSYTLLHYGNPINCLLAVSCHVTP